MESVMDIHKFNSRSVMTKLGWGSLAMIPVVFAIALPSFAQSVVSLGRNFRPDPVAMQASSGGNVSLASIAGIADNCRGFANNSPNHTINLTETFPLLDLLVYSSNITDDPTMLIKGPNGITICADDESGGRNPQISRRLPKGSYQVWVGSKTANQQFNYTLSVSEIRQK
jgi:hypothetical protein